MTGYYNYVDHIGCIFNWVESNDKYFFRYDGVAFPSYYMNIMNAELEWNHLQTFPALNQAIMFNQMKKDII